MSECSNTRASSACCGKEAADPAGRFAAMIPNCLEYARQAAAEGRPLVGILCEYTPRELIMAAGAVPVCLCGGSAKTIPVAEEHLPANLCPLIKSTYGYHVQKSNPFLEMADLVVAETTCDGKKKMYELMAESHTMYVLQLPHNPDDADALGRWCHEVEKFSRFLQDRYDVEITRARLTEAIGVMNRERHLRRQLADLMQGDPPPLSGRQLLDFKSSISGIPADFEAYEEALRTLRAKGPDPALAGRVRVLLTGVPLVHGAERVVEIIERSGGMVVAMENCTGLKPILEDVDADAADPLRAIAEKYYHLPCSVMSPNRRRLDTLGQMVERFRPQCVIELVWQACLTYDVESYRVRRWADAEQGLPYLRIETDYSPSDSERIAMRVEALLETVRGAGPR